MESHSNKERLKDLTKVLGACFESQKTYGQDASKIEKLVKVFDLILEDYDIKVIRDAFVQHLKQAIDFPTPADIINIIDPPVLLDKPTYIAAKGWLAKNKDAPFTLQERDYSNYVKQYEAETMSQQKQESDESVWLTNDESQKLLAELKENGR